MQPRTINEITSEQLAAVIAELRTLIDAHVAEVTAHWIRHRDPSLTEHLKNLDLTPRNNEPPKLAFYRILRELYNHLKVAKHPDEQQLIDMQTFLIKQLSSIKECNYPHTNDEYNTPAIAIEAALQSLIKHTHVIRQREDITNDYLARLTKTIETLTTQYHHYTDHHLFSSDEATISTLTELTNTSAPTQADKNNLQKYYDLLSHLFNAIEKSVHQDNEHIIALRELLLLELQTQKESNWTPPTGAAPENSFIRQSLINISETAEFKSREDQAFAEKWELYASALNNPQHLSTWNEMIKDQGWHIRDNHFKEVMCAVPSIFGFNPEGITTERSPMSPLSTKRSNHSDPDLFVLLDGDNTTQSLKDNIHQLSNDIERYKANQLATCNLVIKALDQQIKTSVNPTTTRSLQNNRQQFIHDKAAIQQGFEYDTDLLAMIESCQEKKNELAQYQTEKAKNEMQKLADLHAQLKIWTPRNLSILFLENFMQGQIKRLSDASSTVTDDMLAADFDKMIHNLGAALKACLDTVNHLHQCIKDESDLIRAHFKENNVRYDTWQLPTYLTPYDAAYEALTFVNYATTNLSLYTDAKHYQEAQKRIRYDGSPNRCDILPDREEVLAFCATAHADDTTPPRPAQSSPSLLTAEDTRQRVATIHAFEVAEATDLNQRSTRHKILIGLAIGIAAAVVLAGIAAAVIFTGGAVIVPTAVATAAVATTTLSAGGIAGILTAIGLAGVFGGLLGGWLYARQTTAQPSAGQPQDNEALNTQGSNTLSINSALGTTPGLPSGPEQETPTPTPPTSPALWASPTSQSQDRRVALTRSVSPH